MLEHKTPESNKSDCDILLHEPCGHRDARTWKGESNASKPTASAFGDHRLSPGSSRARGRRDMVLLWLSDPQHCYWDHGRLRPEIRRRLRADLGGRTAPCA